MKLIKEEAEIQKSEMRSLLEKQRCNLQAKMKTVNQLDEEFAKLMQQGEDVKRDVQRFVDNLVAVIEAKRQNILSSLEKETRRSLDLVTERKTEIQRQITAIESSLENADKLLTRSSNAEIVQSKKSLDTIFEGVDQTAPIDRDNKSLPAGFVFEKNIKLLETVKTDDIKKNHFVKPFQLKPVLTFGEEGSSLDMLNNPFGLAVNARDEIAVSDNFNHTIKIFNSDGNYLGSFGRWSSEAGELEYPRGIVFHNNGNIFVADNSSRIQIFNGRGEFVRSFGGRGHLDNQLNDPLGLSVDSDGNVIVADRGNSLIKIFSPDGKFLMKIGGQGFFKSSFHCIQYDRYFIVSDNDEDCIKVFDRNRNFQYAFGKEGRGDGEFRGPCFIAVNKSGHLMICDGSNDRVQVFEPNGKFIGKFGTKGSSLGEFKFPTSLAILSNDRIAVYDHDNHRIQIFE